MILFPVLILSLLLTIVLTPLFMRLAARANAYDIPDARKVHHMPIPRVGGIAMAVSIFIPILIWSPLETPVRAFLAGALIIIVFGLIDDLKGLDFKFKFAAQITAALVAVLYGGVKIVNLGSLLPDGMVLPNWIAVILTSVAIVGVTNAINLADGLDGLAGGISLLIFICIAYLAHLDQNIVIAIIAVAFIGAIFGFLRFNTYPATLFMGDTGSQLLGFSAAFLSISLTQGNTPLSPLLPLIILGFPVLDTLTVMGDRIARGDSPFSADMKHFHHRLVRMGLFHTEAVFVIYVIQAFIIISAYVLRFHSDWLLLSGYLVFSGLIVSTIYVARIKGWALRRFDFIDRAVKGNLRRLREKGFFIRFIFQPLEICAPMLLILICFLPAQIPRYFAIVSSVIVIVFGMVWYLRREWAKGFLILMLYLLIPPLVYVCETNTALWTNITLRRLYNLSFLFFAALSFITLRLTRRKAGFKITPMDFLVLFVALGLFLLPDLRAQFGAMAMNVIMLFFIFEIILGEVREKIGKVALLTIAACVVVAVRGF